MAMIAAIIASIVIESISLFLNLLYRSSSFNENVSSCLDDAVRDDALLASDFESFDNVEYITIATTNIALRNILPANHVCGIKYFKNNGSFTRLKETNACIKSIKALVRNPIPTNRLNLQLTYKHEIYNRKLILRQVLLQ